MEMPRQIVEKIEALRAEIAALEREAREEIPAQMQSAQAIGPVRENADMYLVAGRAHYVQGRLRDLRHRVESLEKLDAKSIPRERAGYGSILDLVDLETGCPRRFRLVSAEEVDGGGDTCSLLSPVGRSLMGRREGDEVEVRSPGGSRLYRVEVLWTIFDLEEQG